VSLYLFPRPFIPPPPHSTGFPLPIRRVSSSPLPVPSVNGSSTNLITLTNGEVPHPDVASNPTGWAADLLGFNATHITLNFDFSDDYSAKAMRLDYFHCPQWEMELQKLFIDDTYELPVSKDHTSSCTGISSHLYNLTSMASGSPEHLALMTSGWLYLAEITFYSETNTGNEHVSLTTSSVHFLTTPTSASTTSTPTNSHKSPNSNLPVATDKDFSTSELFTGGISPVTDQTRIPSLTPAEGQPPFHNAPQDKKVDIRSAHVAGYMCMYMYTCLHST